MDAESSRGFKKSGVDGEYRVCRGEKMRDSELELRFDPPRIGFTDSTHVLSIDFTRKSTSRHLTAPEHNFLVFVNNRTEEIQIEVADRRFSER